MKYESRHDLKNLIVVPSGNISYRYLRVSEQNIRREVILVRLII